MKKEVFVFGSNRAGIHGAGAALYAKQHHGAVSGRGYGLQGSSFAIPTKDTNIQTMPLHEIEFYVRQFLTFAAEHPQYTFNVTRIGCGLAGYGDSDIMPLFVNNVVAVPENVILPKAWGGEGFDE